MNGGYFIKDLNNEFVANDISFDEVGIINIIASVADNDYLGAGNISGPESENIGRFVPYGFEVSTNKPELMSGCNTGGYTYYGEDFTYAVQPNINLVAVNKYNIKTESYAGDFFKLNATNLIPSYSSNSDISTLDSSNASSDVQVSEAAPGEGLIIYGDGGGLTFPKVSEIHLAPLTAEINLTVNLIDTDGVFYSSNPYQINNIIFQGGNEFYQGRVVFKNSFGSELTDLIVPYAVEYFNGSTYEINTKDSCTQLSREYFLTTSAPESMLSEISVNPLFGGVGEVILTKPTPEGTVGYLDFIIDLSSSGANMHYLQHDWPYDGNIDGIYNDNPKARGTFGIYNGEQAIIYIKR